MVAALFRECFDLIVATSGRDLILVMVYGRNISGQVFGGIYCIVLMVSSCSCRSVEIFWAGDGGATVKGYFQALFFCIEELLPLCFLQLKKLNQYSRDIQLTIFKGTSMLEKDLHGATL